MMGTFPRPLTERERELVRWMIEHGEVSADEKAVLLSQLADASVVARCGCGCASINFAIGGRTPQGRGMRIVSDFVFGTENEKTLTGIFVFSREQLAGIEVYSLAADDVCVELPTPSELRSQKEHGLTDR